MIKHSVVLWLVLLSLISCSSPEDEPYDSMVLVEAGQFGMGLSLEGEVEVTRDLILSYESDASEIAVWANTPLHQVTLSRDFWISRFEVSQRWFSDVLGYQDPIMDRNGQTIPDDQPASTRYWIEAVIFCNALSEREGLDPAYSIPEELIKTHQRYAAGEDIHRDIYPSVERSIYGFTVEEEQHNQLMSNKIIAWQLGEGVEWNRDANGYRLPTEAEWEYAARGGNEAEETVFPGTNDFGEACIGRNILPINSAEPNELGLFGMCGNADEFVWDLYHPEYYSFSPSVDPIGPTLPQIQELARLNQRRRGSRGGAATSQMIDPTDFTVWVRNIAPGDWRYRRRTGFRIARNAVATD